MSGRRLTSAVHPADKWRWQQAQITCLLGSYIMHLGGRQSHAAGCALGAPVFGLTGPGVLKWLAGLGYDSRFSSAIHDLAKPLTKSVAARSTIVAVTAKSSPLRY